MSSPWPHTDEASLVTQSITRQAVGSQRGEGMHRGIEKLFQGTHVVNLAVHYRPLTTKGVVLCQSS